MAIERKFVKGDRTATTRVPSAAVRMLAEGWREATERERGASAERPRRASKPTQTDDHTESE